MGELIKQLKAEGIGIFLISHDLHDVFDLADRVTVMKNGPSSERPAPATSIMTKCSA